MFPRDLYGILSNYPFTLAFYLCILAIPTCTTKIYLVCIAIVNGFEQARQFGTMTKILYVMSTTLYNRIHAQNSGRCLLQVNSIFF